MKAYFVSDLHLKSEDSSDGVIFLNFLKKIETTASHLVLLGDIFDLWVGNDKYFEDKYSQIILQIKKLLSQGVEIHYFEGNHDLHLKKYWQETLGIKVHTDFQIFKWGNHIIRAEHGDLINPDDTGYLFLRKFLRSPAITFLAHHLPGKIIGFIGDLSSQASRSYTDGKKNDIKRSMQKNTRNYIEKAFNESPFDLFIYGHTHIDDDFNFEILSKNVRCINLGTWLDKPKYLLVTADHLELHTL